MASKPSAAFKEARYSLFNIFVTDPRPTLVIDLLNTTFSRGVHLELANNAFTDQYGVLLRFIVSGQVLEPDFIDWLKSPEPTISDYPLGDLSWKFFILEHRWKIVNVAASHTTGGRKIAGADHTTSPVKDNLVNVAGPASITNAGPSGSGARVGEVGSTLTVALPSGLVSLGSAPTALEGLHRTVDMLDVGFFEYDLEGVLIFANKSWYTLSGHPLTPQAHTQMRFMDLCHPDDAQLVINSWNKLIRGNPVTFEMRWKHTGSQSAKQLGAQWVLAATVPLYDENGKLRSISGCTTDINNQKLSEQIAHSRAEALERARTFEQRFVRFASVAPIVIFNFDANKRMTYCNDRWFQVTTSRKKPYEEIDIGEGFFEEDAVKLYALVDDAISNKDVNTLEMRVKKIWYASDGRRAQPWVLASIFAEFTNDGTFQGCTGTVMDISEFKYAETLQRIRLDDALEAKRQQENFIDMTSHEMRNPLSAMVQCADSALTAVSEIRRLIESSSVTDNDTFRLETLSRARVLEEVEIGIEGILFIFVASMCILNSEIGLETILSCCAHQKCIIDDVLTLSKLDSNLLAITPVKVQPSRVMQEVIKMFEMDALKAEVNLTTRTHRSINKLNVEWLMMDPSRVKQILINLVNNAIKFTRKESIRNVILEMSASLHAPASSSNGGVKYAPASRSVSDDLLVENEWGLGEVVYLQFSLQDTGRGLSHKEQEKLFHRFSQASPRTHVDYGGSGLGLFITRQLTELQGGEIGVASEKDKGSTFAFYIQTRRTTAPENPRPPSARLTSSTAQIPPLALPVKPLHGDSAANTKDSVNASDEGHLARLMFMQQTDWKPSVLIVEDNMVNQKVLSKQLQRIGYKVSVANHGVEALDFLKTTNIWYQNLKKENQRQIQTVDVVLMDIEMPVMGGMECTRRIRQLETQDLIRRPQPGQENYHDRQHHQLPIISTSANARIEQNNEQSEAGVDDIMTKPFRIPQLVDKIWRLLGRDDTSAFLCADFERSTL